MANEMRLVGYDPIAFGEFIQSLVNTLEVYDPYSDGYEDAVGRIEDWLGFNHVNAVEVVHGRWLEGTKSFRSGTIFAGHCCSVCDEFNVRNSNYCPNCGADMRERSEGE